MNEDLRKLIVQYQEAIRQLFPRVAAHLNVKLPIANSEWVGLNAKQEGETSDGIKYFIHGYGITMNDGKVTVDFDLGDKGQIDGFDAGRLSRFADANRTKTRLKDVKEIDSSIKEAVASGEVMFSGYLLYYLRE